MTYILRHTQLQPRQLLVYLNAISSKNYKKTGCRLSWDAKTVFDEVRETAARLRQEIFVAYKYRYPGTERVGGSLAKTACDLFLPQLDAGSAHTYEELRDAYEACQWELLRGKESKT